MCAREQVTVLRKIVTSDSIIIAEQDSIIVKVRINNAYLREKNNAIPIGQPYYRPGETIIGTDGKAYTVKMPIMAPSDVHPNCVCVNIEEMSE